MATFSRPVSQSFIVSMPLSHTVFKILSFICENLNGLRNLEHTIFGQSVKPTLNLKYLSSVLANIGKTTTKFTNTGDWSI